MLKTFAGVGRKGSAKVWPLEIFDAVDGGAVEMENRKGEFGSELFVIKRVVDGVAGLRVGEFEAKCFASGNARSGASKTDPGGGERAEFGPAIGCDGFWLGHGIYKLIEAIFGIRGVGKDRCRYWKEVVNFHRRSACFAAKARIREQGGGGATDECRGRRERRCFGSST